MGGGSGGWCLTLRVVAKTEIIGQRRQRPEQDRMWIAEVIVLSCLEGRTKRAEQFVWVSTLGTFLRKISINTHFSLDLPVVMEVFFIALRISGCLRFMQDLAV